MKAAAILLLSFLLQNPSPSKPQDTPPTKVVQPVDKIDKEIAQKLLGARRIYVDGFGDDNDAKQLQAMIINSLQASKRFILTENREKADAILKGRALEKTSQEFHASGEATSVAGAAGAHSGSASGVVVGGSGTVSGSHRGGFVAHGAAIEDSVASTETINEARVAVRLVTADGDVVWSTTQESKGGKYKGASEDCADKVVKQLLRDLDKLEKGRSQPSPGEPQSP